MGLSMDSGKLHFNLWALPTAIRKAGLLATPATYVNEKTNWCYSLKLIFTTVLALNMAGCAENRPWQRSLRQTYEP